MSTFFTVPKSQKRKRKDATSASLKKLRIGGNGVPAKSKESVVRDDGESISGSDSDLSVDEGYESALSRSSEERETAAEKRLRLAEEYLESVRKETEQEIGFDAEEIDRDLIAERLKEDVAESKGRLYRHIASDFDWVFPSRSFLNDHDKEITTAVAIHGQHIFTASKSLRITKWKISRSPAKSRNEDVPEAAPASQPRSPQSELSKAKRRKLREKRRKSNGDINQEGGSLGSNRVIKMRSCKGSHRRASDRSYQHHVSCILCLACSPDGKYLVSGGADRRLIVWDAEKLIPKRVFTQHRAAITGLAFRRNSNQLFSASADRTIKVWSLDELAYVETLFGHQDEVYDVGALGLERCVSVGGRDRTARVWKVLEETQLVFRGGGSADKREKKKGSLSSEDLELRKAQSGYGEGSIDRVALIDDELFVTGSDNGSLCLWNVQKKKPLHTIYLAHGLDPPLSRGEAFADLDPKQHTDVPGPPLPRWITSLAVLPYSDLVISGSWDGHIRIWRVTQDKRRLESLGSICEASAKKTIFEEDLEMVTNGMEESGSLPAVVDAPSNSASNDLDTATLVRRKPVPGIINDLVLSEEGERGNETLYIVAGTGKEHRLGRWIKRPGKNGAYLFAISKARVLDNGTNGFE